jgi:hypothetical protein
VIIASNMVGFSCTASCRQSYWKSRLHSVLDPCGQDVHHPRVHCHAPEAEGDPEGQQRQEY